MHQQYAKNAPTVCQINPIQKIKGNHVGLKYSNKQMPKKEQWWYIKGYKYTINMNLKNKFGIPKSQNATKPNKEENSGQYLKHATKRN